MKTKLQNIACIIDDDKMFTYLVSKQIRLQNLCDTIISFGDGEEALRYLRPIIETPDTLPSVILLDINMPVLDGWQFLDEFTKFAITSKVKVYIVSSSIDRADQMKAASYKDVSNFYAKPITNEQLVEMLKDFNH
ncbi:response regulator [Mucilaginibacter lacusdianchii]|uniref:response regulator n=1 Tax=Mucilaginibacter lacusdianchii TaxID=2684211 RepID=UPI00131CF886|nr:response regulator [Mucilaginibacter sp. JXJ CY 39]